MMPPMRVLRILQQMRLQRRSTRSGTWQKCHEEFLRERRKNQPLGDRC
jgi:hypothetical protein